MCIGWIYLSSSLELIEILDSEDLCLSLILENLIFSSSNTVFLHYLFLELPLDIFWIF